MIQMSNIAFADRRREMPQNSPIGAAPVIESTQLLSSREQEIAAYVARGLSNKEIARELGISHWTVSAHLRRSFTKLGISRRMELCLLLNTAARL